MEKQVSLFSELIATADKKKDFSDGVMMINLVLKTMAVGNGETWANVCDSLLASYLNTSPPLSIIITPLINLTKAAQDLQTPQLLASVTVLLRKWWHPVTNLLDFSQTRHEFTLSTVVMQLHVCIVQLLKQCP